MTLHRFSRLFLVLLGLAAAGPLEAQDEIAKQAITAFKRNIDSSDKDEQAEAIYKLKDADCGKGAALLADIFNDDDVVLQICAFEVMKKYGSPEAVDYIINKGLRGRKAKVREWCAKAIGYMNDPGPEAPSALMEILAKEKKPEAKAAMIRALGRLKHEPAVPLILKSVKDKSMAVRLETAYGLGKIPVEGNLSHLITLFRDPIWQVRVQALVSLAKLKDPDIIPVLIKRLPKENGRLREDIIAQLGEMTGQDYGTEHQKWTVWWNENQEAFRKEFGKKKRRRYQKKQYADGYSYYNITTYSKRFIFILDCSGSMVETVLPAKSYGYGLEQIPRIDLAKQELVKLIQNMTEDTAFDIIYFAGYVDKWKGGLEAANKRTKADAVKFVENLQCIERGEILQVTTNLYGALDKVFSMVEESMKKSGKRYGTAADTIFVLSDGVPTGPDWLTDRDTIVSVAKERNRHLKMRIHTISLAGDLETPRFLAKLSSPNGGEMKDVLKE